MTTPPPAIAPPEITDAESRRLVEELTATLKARRGELYELIERVAWELSVYVPVVAGRVDGRRWPHIAEDPSDSQRRIAHFFSSPDRAEGVIDHSGDFERLSGIEALRWAWAWPSNVDEITIDFAEDCVRFPSHWSLWSLFPAARPVDTLDGLPSRPLPQLLAERGAHPLRPGIARALMSNELRPSPPALRPVKLDGRSLLAVPAAGDGAPMSTLDQWWRASAGADGVVYDPEGPHPLVLEHSDLLILNLWKRNGRRPAPPQVVEALQTADVSARIAGRIVADLPEYWIKVSRDPERGVFGTLPERDRMIWFSDVRKIERWSQRMQAIGYRTPELTSSLSESRWSRSAIKAAEQHESVAIDPVAPDTAEGLASDLGALVLDHTALTHAAERLDERLRPRV